MAYPEHLELDGLAFDRWDARRDLAALLSMAGDPAIERFIGLPGDEEGLGRMSERFAQHWEQCGFGLWAIRPPGCAGAGWAGACHPRWHPEYETRVELAWSITSSLRGRGLVTRAARTAASACFTDLGLEEILAFVEPSNDASFAVCRRLGMRHTGETIGPENGMPLRIFTLRAAELPAV